MRIKRNPLVQLPNKEIAYLKHYYILLKYNIENLYPESSEIIGRLIEAFMHNIMSLICVYGKETEKNEQVIHSRSNVIFEKFMALLTKYHTQERCVKFYASKMCLTPNYISGAIKECSGKNALEWINEYVILEAKTLLKFSGLSIQEIAYKLNFPTQSAFGKYFKQQTGITPQTIQTE